MSRFIDVPIEVHPKDYLVLTQYILYSTFKNKSFHKSFFFSGGLAD